MTDKIMKTTFEKNTRILVISDIHTNIPRFERLLEKMNYQPGSDYLIINGDMIEKGNKNIETLAYFQELQISTSRVVILQGNCEAYVVEGGDILPYIRYRKRSIINEWLSKQQIDVFDETLTEEKVYEVLWENYESELLWLKNLPIALETDEFVIVHAGVSKGDAPFANKYDLLSQRGFFNKGHDLHQTVIVGHFPVVNYHVDKPMDASVLFDEKKRIISLDGGNQINEDGQLNGLEISWDNTSSITYKSYSVDEYPTVTIKQTFNAPEVPIHNVIWPYGFEEGKVLEVHEDFSLCQVNDLEHLVFFKNEYIDRNHSDGYILKKYHATYQLSVSSGDKVKIIDTTCSGYDYIKKDGVFGWIPKGVLTKNDN